MQTLSIEQNDIGALLSEIMLPPSGLLKFNRFDNDASASCSGTCRSGVCQTSEK